MVGTNTSVIEVTDNGFFFFGPNERHTTLNRVCVTSCHHRREVVGKYEPVFRPSRLNQNIFSPLLRYKGSLVLDIPTLRQQLPYFSQERPLVDANTVMVRNVDEYVTLN